MHEPGPVTNKSPAEASRAGLMDSVLLPLREKVGSVSGSDEGSHRR